MADIVTRVFWGKKSIGKFGHRFKVFPHLLHDTDVMLHILVCFWLRKHLEILYVDPCQVTISGFSSMLEAASFFFFFFFFFQVFFSSKRSLSLDDGRSWLFCQYLIFRAIDMAKFKL